MGNIQAKDCKCVLCQGQAVAFYPVIDLDIKSHPYCRACLDELKLKILIRIYEDERKKE